MTNPELPNLSDPLATFDFALARYNALVLFTEHGGIDEDDLADDEIAVDAALKLTPAERELFAARVGEELSVSELHRLWADAGVVPDEHASGMDARDRMYEVAEVLTLARKFFRQGTEYRTAGQLMQRCLEQALVFPERHGQDTWFQLQLTTDGDGNASLCGSTGCLAGHAVLLGSEQVPVVDVHSLIAWNEFTVGYVRAEDNESTSDPGVLAEELLALTSDEAEVMFDPSRILDELWVLGAAFYPGLVSRVQAEARRAEIVAAGPQLVITRVALEDNGVIDAADLHNRRTDES